MSEPKYPERHVVSVIDPYSDQLRSWLETDSHRPKRDRRTAKIMFEAIKAQGYTGSYVRAWNIGGGVSTCVGTGTSHSSRCEGDATTKFLLFDSAPALSLRHRCATRASR